MVVAPPSAHGTPWMRRFGNASTAFASGWMRVRGHRRRRSVDRGFVLSDHVDWPSLLAAVQSTGAECVWVTHGYREPVVRWLREHGLQAQSVASRWEGETDESDVVVETEDGGEPSGAAEERPESAMLDTLDSPPGFR
jgi:putative mRNA 3-end processing factor